MMPISSAEKPVDGGSRAGTRSRGHAGLLEPAGDVPGDLGHLEVAPLDVVEPEPRGPDPLQRAFECLKVPGLQIDREVVPGGEVAAAPGAGVSIGVRRISTLGFGLLLRAGFE